MPRTPRPDRTYATGRVTSALRIGALLGTAGIAAWLLLQYPSLPETIPTHFGVSGEADDWGHKSSVLWLAGVMVALAALLAWLSTRPRWANYPTSVTEQNAQRLYREGERMLVWLLAAITVVFAGLALLTTGGSGMPLLGLGIAGMLASTLAGLVRLLRVTGSNGTGSNGTGSDLP